MGRAKTGQIGKVVTFSRCPECMLSVQMIRLYNKSQTGRPKSGRISKVVRLSGWSDSKVPLYLNAGEDRGNRKNVGHFQSINAKAGVRGTPHPF